MGLAEWYHHNYDHRELAGMLAAYVLSGEQPPIPDIATWTAAPQLRGRPSAEVEAKRLERLREILETHYPVQIDAAFVSGQTGMARSTVIRLTQNLDFIRSLPAHLRPYFQGMPVASVTRLTALWRGLLDLHYYMLMLTNPPSNQPTRPRLYDWHAMLWGAPHQHSNHDLAMRNIAELDRVAGPVTWIGDLAAKNILPDLPDPKWGDQPFINPCQDGCPLVHAYLNGGTSVTYVGGARAVLAEGMPNFLIENLPEVEPETIIDARNSTGVVKQILGVV